ncbi:ferric-chelate reductase 1-like [Glandiceps talaboti]
MAGLVHIVFLTAVVAVGLTQDQPLVTSEGCGETKGCFKEPSDCEASSSESTCDILITWEAAANSDESTIFGITGKVASGEEYVAMGLSNDQRMRDADVWSCLQLDTLDVVLDHSYNNVYANIQGDTAGSSDFTYVTTDGVIQCTFTRLNKMEGSEDRFFDLYANEYYLLIARGPRDDSGSPKLAKHINSPLISDDTVNFTAVSSAGGGSASQAAQKAHGSLMIFGWIGCASVAIVMARYFKPMWPNSTLLGQKVWFTIHRTLMVINLLCFCAAFIVIFVYVEGWLVYESPSDLRFIHAVIGCIVVALGITNPILALFRPHPGTRKYNTFRKDLDK